MARTYIRNPSSHATCASDTCVRTSRECARLHCSIVVVYVVVATVVVATVCSSTPPIFPLLSGGFCYGIGGARVKMKDCIINV